MGVSNTLQPCLLLPRVYVMALFNMPSSILFLGLVAVVLAGANTVDSDRDTCDEAKTWCTGECQTLPGDATCTAKCSLFVTRTYTCSDLEVESHPMLGYVSIPEQLTY